MMRIRRVIRTVSTAAAAISAPMTAKCLIYAPDQAIYNPTACQLENVGLAGGSIVSS
jgi:hypothetical protein